MKRAYDCDGISTRQHNEPGGSREVWHYHLHVTPRFREDDFYNNIYHKVLLSEAERAHHAERLARLLTDGEGAANE